MDITRNLVAATLTAQVEAHGPQALIETLNRVLIRNGEASAQNWWPDPVRRQQIDRIKQRMVDAFTDRSGAAPTGATAIALVELLAELLADAAGPEGYAAAVVNLVPALSREVLLAMKPDGAV